MTPDSASGAPDRRARIRGAAALALVFLVFFGFNYRAGVKEYTRTRIKGQINTHIRLAEELLNGRLEFSEPFYKDIAEFEGHYYSPFPPFPAAFLVPFVALFGPHLITLALTPWMGALTGWILFRVLRRLGVSPPVGYWAAAGFLLGSVYWLILREAWDTYFAHAVATLMVFLALEAAAYRRGGLLAGLYLGCAFLSRQLTVLALPFLWALQWSCEEDHGRRRRALWATMPGLALCLGLYLFYNQVRFHHPLESGYAFIPETGWYARRLALWGVTDWVYIPSNFVRLFIQGFCLEFNDPHLMAPTISTSGTSLTFASPFFFFALRGRFRDRPLLNWAGWGGIGLCAVAVMMNKNAMGGWQINGVRYALDFLPVLLVFAARGMERYAATPHRVIWKGAIVYSIALNLLAFAFQHGAGWFKSFY